MFLHCDRWRAPRLTVLLGAIGDRVLRVARSAYRGVEDGIRLVTDIARQTLRYASLLRAGNLNAKRAG
ncbi:MAG: hypothetical protein A3J75_01910 [Acidobacteria bacterium RBG_16_68_9]|nr:MAG: hypothetical protein A3J75_01910 [Acidobacteria bacterium RBG_16_68_9]